MTLKFCFSDYAKGEEARLLQEAVWPAVQASGGEAKGGALQSNE